MNCADRSYFVNIIEFMWPLHHLYSPHDVLDKIERQFERILTGFRSDKILQENNFSEKYDEIIYENNSYIQDYFSQLQKQSDYIVDENGFHIIPSQNNNSDKNSKKGIFRRIADFCKDLLLGPEKEKEGLNTTTNTVVED